ncbi:Phosphatidylethanolamine-binding protein [Dioscorea alata]|uniref:Phosphatidylethanolamine-binding protein n=1 Tax=Dioscorea alata TaxID=55571 RepID=A0ACB7WEA6_DIOAL|nr:Phosphatidylethanolamine-binding protein [Dioscorea alata]
MTNNVDPLIVGRVIGNVLDLFVPEVFMSVNYGPKHISNGCEIKPSFASYAPTVQITGKSCDHFTLVMVDPDSPNPSEPLLREWVHWVVVNIPGGTNPLYGDEVVPYMGPTPHLGIHMYVLVQFQQKPPFPPMTPPASRANFNTRDFAANFNLGQLVSAIFFNAQREPKGRKH